MPAYTSQLSPELKPAMQEVLSNCPVEDQLAAMHPEGSLDWANLELSACYQLSLDLTAGKGEYRGDLRITFPNRTGQALDEIVFRLYPNADVIFGGGLEVEQIQVEGEIVEAEVFLEDATGLRVPLPASLPARDTLEMQMVFSGQAPVDFGGGSGVYGGLNYATEIPLLSLANAYPILAVWQAGNWQASEVLGLGDAVVSETALYELEILAPRGWQVVASGSEISSHSVEEGTFHMVTGPVREIVIVASPAFTLREASVDGVQVRHWGLSSGESYWGEVQQMTMDSLRVFSNHFGKYPYSELDVVTIPMLLASGIEYPGVFLLRETLYQPNPEEPYLLGMVVSHEAAHQWWYGVVGSDVLIHPWQDEALATFSSLLYLEAFQPEYFHGSLRYFQQVSDQYQHVPIEQPVSAFLGRPEEYSSVIYFRGAALLQELREQLGEEPFFEALRAYYNQNAYQLNEPSELLEIFETQCECDLSGVYRRWGVE
jgi:aminopeptidase N